MAGFPPPYYGEDKREEALSGLATGRFPVPWAPLLLGLDSEWWRSMQRPIGQALDSVVIPVGWRRRSGSRRALRCALPARRDLPDWALRREAGGGFDHGASSLASRRFGVPVDGLTEARLNATLDSVANETTVPVGPEDQGKRTRGIKGAHPMAADPAVAHSAERKGRKGRKERRRHRARSAPAAAPNATGRRWPLLRWRCCVAGEST